MSKQTMARKLESLGYAALFLTLDGAQQKKVLASPGAEDDLRALVQDEGARPVPRFLAAELLAGRSKRRSAVLPPRKLAQVYMAGLRAGASQFANPWGLPGSLGPVSQRVVGLGSAASSAVMEALDDETAMRYAGSREATVGNSYNWRVKDQAAALLAALRGERFEPDTDPRKRDRAIAELKKEDGARGTGGKRR